METQTQTGSERHNRRELLAAQLWFVLACAIREAERSGVHFDPAELQAVAEDFASKVKAIVQGGR